MVGDVGTHIEQQRAPAAWDRAATLATRQFGVVEHGQLLAVGIGARAIQSLRQRQRLHVVYRGVYAVGHRHLDRNGRLMAAVLACGPGAVLSHLNAAALWGLARFRTRTDVTTRTRVRSRPGFVAHRSRTLTNADRTVLNGLPLTTPSRTLLDLASVLAVSQLRSAYEEADRLGLLQLPDLIAQCDRNPGRPGTGHLRRWASEAAAPTPGATELERLVIKVCDEHGLPRPETNVTIAGYEADNLWPESRVIAEADSFEFHRSRAVFERDRRRDIKHRLAGYTVVRLTHRRLTYEPDQVAEELRALLAGPPPVPTIR